ncbi:c-type cytochrome [Acidiphilium sp.]|uniref:c-type cytochrome n=1 Tax=Acidiphilium sp. TaxID=527 RepID=UPI003CFDAC88
MALAIVAPPAFAANRPLSDHARAQAALADIKAAIATIMAAENATASGPSGYVASAQRAINALVGMESRQFDPHEANPGDAAGAIGQVNHLLDRTANPPFVPALHGVLINVQAAVGDLQDARRAKGLSAFQIAASRALQVLEIAEGRTSQYDVFGGMEGAIANTELGVPEGASMENGCKMPRAAGYGLVHGWLIWHASADRNKSIAVEGSARARQEGSMLVLYSHAAAMTRQLCARHAAGSSSNGEVQPTRIGLRPAPVRLIDVAATSGGGVSYTMAQAKAGKTIYTENCASCHGVDLQGVAAPAIAGTDFLTTAAKNGYTISILRTIVTQNMPFNNPASLDPTQYAAVMAYLLASNCYPSGKTAFPAHGTAGFGAETLSIRSHPDGKPSARGVCPVG